MDKESQEGDGRTVFVSGLVAEYSRQEFKSLVKKYGDFVRIRTGSRSFAFVVS